MLFKVAPVLNRFFPLSHSFSYVSQISQSGSTIYLISMDRRDRKTLRNSRCSKPILSQGYRHLEHRRCSSYSPAVVFGSSAAPKTTLGYPPPNLLPRSGCSRSIPPRLPVTHRASSPIDRLTASAVLVSVECTIVPTHATKHTSTPASLRDQTDFSPNLESNLTLAFAQLILTEPIWRGYARGKLSGHCTSIK